jgi:pimeloyl-ACP methyl ester carboxylesterase
MWATAITHRFIDVHGLRMHLAEAGPEDGPVVLLLHGFPECWYSWPSGTAGRPRAHVRLGDSNAGIGALVLLTIGGSNAIHRRQPDRSSNAA